MIRRRSTPQPKALWTQAFPDQVKEDARTRQNDRIEQYHIRVRIFKRKNSRCQCCVIVNMRLFPNEAQRPQKPNRTNDCHHWAGREITRDGERRVDLLLYEPWWIATCRRCHKYIHAHDQWARGVGLLAPVSQWNRPPPV